MENPFVYSFNEKRYHTFNYYLKTAYGCKVAKVGLKTSWQSTTHTDNIGKWNEHKYTWKNIQYWVVYELKDGTNKVAFYQLNKNYKDDGETTRGFRCKLGKDFLTIYPNIQLSVKDGKNPDGTVKVATAKDVKANNAKSRLGCTVSSKFSDLFEASVSWQKVDKYGNAVDEEEDDITQGNGNVDPNSGDTPDDTTPVTPDPGTGGGGGADPDDPTNSED